MRGLEEAFASFDGVPAELLFDQMKSVIVDDQRMMGGELLKNPEFLRFAAHSGFTVRACRPYRAQTKVKVERPIRYARQSFFYGRHYLNDAALNPQAWSWLERTANARKHPTTGERPRVGDSSGCWRVARGLSLWTLVGAERLLGCTTARRMGEPAVGIRALM